MTSEGGWDGKGSIYEYDAVTNTVDVKKYFGLNPGNSRVAGSTPTGNLV